MLVCCSCCNDKLRREKRFYERWIRESIATPRRTRGALESPPPRSRRGGRQSARRRATRNRRCQSHRGHLDFLNESPILIPRRGRGRRPGSRARPRRRPSSRSASSPVVVVCGWHIHRAFLAGAWLVPARRSKRALSDASTRRIPSSPLRVFDSPRDAREFRARSPASRPRIIRPRRRRRPRRRPLPIARARPRHPSVPSRAPLARQLRQRVLQHRVLRRERARQPLERVHASPRVPLERPLPRPRRRARRAIRLESTRASRRVVLAARRHRARVGVCVDAVGTRGVGRRRRAFRLVGARRRAFRLVGARASIRAFYTARTPCAHICDAGKPSCMCARVSVPCVCYGLAFERVAAGSRARGHTTNARAGSRARGARDATHRRRRVYIDARDARNRRSNATDARSDGINTRGRRGDGAPRSWRRRRRRRRRARESARERGDRSKRSVNASFWMIWCAATLERANGDGMGDIKNADARGRAARGARGGRAKRATRTRARRLTTTRSTVIGFRDRY